MIEIIKLRSLSLRIDFIDQFHDCYVKMLAEAWVEGDRERINVLREILHQQVAFVSFEMVKAKKEENETDIGGLRSLT